MKKILAATFALFVLAGASQAQTQEKKEHQGRHQKFAQQLNLSADQQARLKSLHEAEKKEMESLKTSSLTAEQSQAKRKEIHEKYRQQSSTIYTPDQKAQLEKMKAERKSKGGHKGVKGRGAKAGDRAGKGGKAGFDKALNLTADQQKQLQQLRSDNRSQMQAVKNDSSLSEDQKKAKMQSLRTAQQEKMKQILTAEQIEKMKSLRKQRPSK